MLKNFYKEIGFIPVRLESMRLPGKALLDLDGLPIIVHTAKRAQLSKLLDEVYVCTDNDEIIDVCKNNKIKTIKTKKNFSNGTERIASVAPRFKNSIIIDTNDAILIAKKTKSEKVKNVVDELSKSKIFEAFENNFEIRPWGKFENLFETNNCKIKQLTIDPKKSLSLQYHNFRSEHWLIIKGTAKVVVDNKEYKLKKGNSIDIPQKSIHRIINETNSKLIIIEIQMGTYFGEDDIIRIDDQYGR